MLLLLLALTGAARAATLTVTSSADSGAGSLRAAVAAANSGDTINFMPGLGTITLTSGLIQIAQPLTITGPATVDGGQMAVSNTSGVVALTGLTLQNSGGLINSGTVTLTQCALVNDSTQYGGGLDNNPGATATLTACALTGDNASYGGGLYNGGTATLTGCALTGDGAQYSGGGLYNVGTLTLTQCALTGDSAGTYNDGRPGGGGLYNGGTATLTACALVGDSIPNYGVGKGGGLRNAGALTLTGCTLTGNSAPAGDVGGLYNSGGTAALTDDILYADSNGEVSVGGGTVTASHCDIQGGYAGTSNLSIAPQFVAPYNSGTRAFDLHLQSGSPVAGAGVAAAGNGADLDGRPRPTPGFSGPSVGAFEAAPSGAYALVVENSSDTLPRSLRTAVQCADDYPNAQITFDPQAFTAPQTILETQGRLILSQPMTVTAPAPGVAVDGQGGHAVVEISAGTSQSPVALVGLTIQHGSAGEGGGVLVDSGTFAALTQCALTGNYASTGGGGLFNNGGTAVLTGCIFSGDNSRGGGGLFNQGTATLTNCALSGNTASSSVGGGLDNGGTLTLTGCTLTGNISYGGSGGGLYNSGTATLTACALTQNSANGSAGNNGAAGGGLFNAGTATLTACALTQNSANGTAGYGAFGGGLENEGRATLTACVLAGNTTSTTNTATRGSGGGGLDNSGTSLTVTGCSFAGNASYGGNGGALENFGVPVTLTDDILYGDTASFSNEVYQVPGSPTPYITASYCDIGEALGAGGDGVADGGHNFDADPLFVTGASPDLAYDLHLRAGSPAIGAGVAAAGNAQDITGRTRANPPAVGAYEGAGAATSTTLTSSLNPSDYGQGVTFTVAVANTSGAPAPAGTAVPTGTVTIHGLPGGDQTLTLATVNGSGQATYQISSLNSGTYTLTASYAPATAAFTASQTPSPLTQTVLVNDRTMLGSSLNPSAVGQSVTFTATVDTEGGPAPAGSVSFSLDGSATPAATVAVSGTTASYATSALAAGTHTVTATFTGAGFVPSTSAALTQTVLALPTANSQSASVAFGTAKGITLTGSDPNSPAQALTYAVATQPQHGTLSGLNAGTGAVTYTPNAGYVGPDSFTFTASNGPGTSAPATVSLSVASPTVSGTVTLSGWLGTGEPTPQLAFTLTPAGSTSGGTTQTLTPTATGTAGAYTFTLPGVAPGSYTLGVKGALWLREDAAVNVSTASAAGVSVTLPPGDVNGDNVIDGNDTALLRLYFNTVSGRSGFNASADLNGDGVVDGNDTALLRAHFNAVGRPF